ncbi:MAG: hypothetical protein ACYC0X_16615 [Pirellulaceae bacterium]
MNTPEPHERDNAREPDSQRAERPHSDQPKDPEAWVAHEHVAPESQLHAERLLDTVGTPELAKLAIDQAQEKDATTPRDDTELARRLGYVSLLDLFEASTPIGTADENKWCITRLASGNWVAWERLNRWVSSEFNSQEAAVEFIHATAHRGQPPSTSPGKPK